MLVDAHCHLDFKDFDKDRNKIIDKCKQVGVGAIICNGVDQKSNKKILKLSEKYDLINSALGLYPSYALNLTDNQIDKHLNFIKEQKSKIIAIGEVGIDFFHIKDEKKRILECKIFKQVIKLANNTNLPLIVHSRKAEGKVLELLTLAKTPVVLHFYCGNAEQIKKAVSRGYYFSIPTTIVKSKTVRTLAKRVPLNQILTETDAPYLCPEQGKRNDPTYIRQSIEKLAEIKNLPAREIEKQIWANYCELFVKN